jgi:DNA-directed RNA polymerase specialized sigma24 family protein
VGLKGFRLNSALLTFVGEEPPNRTSWRPAARREQRASQRLPAESVDRLVAEYRTGTTAAELGQRYGLAKGTVLRLVRQAGVAVRHPRFSADEAARLVALYEAGLPQTEIAKRLERSPTAVWHRLRRLGLIHRD